MAPSVALLQSPAPPVPTTLSSKKSNLTVRGEQAPTTIDDLIRQRSLESECDAPIVAYPSSGTEYVSYSPRQVGSTLPFVTDDAFVLICDKA